MHSRRVSRRRVQPRGSSAGLIVAVVALVGVMGVVIVRTGERKRQRRVRPEVSSVVVEPIAPEPVAQLEPTPTPRSPVRAIRDAVRKIEKQLPDLKRTERGPGFEEKRIALLSGISDARDQVGAYLDDHPSDDAANALWDRVLKLYVALKKI